MGRLTRGGLNFGRNLRLNVLIGGMLFTFNNLITQASFRPLQTLHTETPINNDGDPVRDVTYEGCEVDITLTRQNGQIDALYKALVQNFRNGGAKPDVTLTRTVVNPNGSADRDIWKDGTIEVKHLGTYKHSDTVNDISITITFSSVSDVGGVALPALNTVVAQL